VNEDTDAGTALICDRKEPRGEPFVQSRIWGETGKRPDRWFREVPGIRKGGEDITKRKAPVERKKMKGEGPALKRPSICGAPSRTERADRQKEKRKRCTIAD